MAANTSTIQSTTTLYTFKNKKGETIAQVRALSLADAQYKAGINSQGETTNTSAQESEYVNTDGSGHRK